MSTSRILLPAAATALLLVTPGSRAEIRTREFEYRQGDVVLQGFIAWDAARPGKRPGVLVVHEWWGHNEHARAQARKLAEAGYLGFALDMYGKGKVATHPKDAEAFMTEATKDPALPAARFEAALEQLRKNRRVDPGKIAAIGYCFGGKVVLEMARAGADLDAVASFHGLLATDAPAEKGRIRARVLVLNGEADPMIPPAQVEAFRKEMTDAGVRFEVVNYPGVKHSFTNPRAAETGMEALAYDAGADERSWQKLLDLLEEVFR
jgi:dienelactone hydrolase